MANNETYTVVKGDTLSSIAEKFGMSIEYLAVLNNIPSSHLIYIGQVLKITETVTVSPTNPISTRSSINNMDRPEVTAFGIQSDTERTFFAIWRWTRSQTDKYEIRWFYGTENNVEFTGNSSTIDAIENSEPQSTYTAPTNATYVSFQVKPISKTHKVNDDDVSYWTAQWSTRRTYFMMDLPPAIPPKPTVTVEDYTLKIEVNGIDDEVTEIEFEVIQDDYRVYRYGRSRVFTNSATYYCVVEQGHSYKVRCRAIASWNYGDWTEYSSNVQTKPKAPSKIYEMVAVSDTIISLSWEEVYTADSYDIEYAVKLDYLGASNASTTISNITEPRYTITGLSSGEKYFARVRAVNKQGQSDWTKASSIVLGDAPSAPTTWSSTSTAVVGEEVKLYWMHNAKDGSKEIKAKLTYSVNGGSDTIKEVLKTTVSDDVSYYYLSTRSYTDGAVIRWSVQTAGITGVYGEASATRMINIYAPPTLSLKISNDQIGNSALRKVTKYPFYIIANAGPYSQKPIGFHVSIRSKDAYETVDEFGNVKMISEGQEVFSRFYDVATHDLCVTMTPGDINLENNCKYEVTCVVTMDSGLTKEEKIEFTVSLAETKYYPTAEIAFNEKTLSVNIRPYCMKRPYIFYEVAYDAIKRTYTRTSTVLDPLEGTSVNNALTNKGDLVFIGVGPTDELVYFTVIQSDKDYLVDNVTLSVYRQEYDGRFVAIGTNINNSDGIYITDPHPSLDSARYRVVATDMETGSISYTDIPAYTVGIKSVIIQWDESWNNLRLIGEDPVDEVTWAGSMIKLPYNIDVSDSNSMDVSLIKYIGRSHPVSYYGTQLGTTSTWSVDIPKTDKNTLYGLRRLAIYTGDVYVREPSGSGYWANISVSFAQKHREMVIPVTLEIKRVEGGM